MNRKLIMLLLALTMIVSLAASASAAETTEARVPVTLTVVNTVAVRNGLAADFSPKPLRSEPGNGMHINLSARSSTGEDIMPQVIAGILSHIADMTAFLNTTPASYQRFGSYKAPR